MQNLITLVGLASLANAASLVTTGNLQMAASQDKKRENHEEANDLEAGSFVLGGPLTGFKKNFCDPCKQDDVCEPRYLNNFCDFTIDNDANNLVYGATKTLVTELDLPSSVRFVTQSPPTANNLVCPYQVFWQDVAVPSTAPVLIFESTATSTAQMIELEIGAASTFATVWSVQQLRQSCKGACPPKTQTVYQRQASVSPALTDLTWYYPKDPVNEPILGNPHPANLISSNLGNLVFSLTTSSTTVPVPAGCVINFRQIQMIDPIYVFDDQLGCNLDGCCTGGCF